MADSGRHGSHANACGKLTQPPAPSASDDRHACCAKAGLASRALRVAGLAGLAALAGCAVNPSTGRSQLVPLPGVQIAHADTGYALTSAALGLARTARCGSDGGPPGQGADPSVCPSAGDAFRFARQVDRVGTELAAEAARLAPELMRRIGAFQIVVDAGIDQGTASSAGGRIAISPDLVRLDPTDDVIAFLVAREMGRIIARHGEEDSGARILFSALTTVIPIGGLMVRFATSMLGSQVLKASWAEAQRREADELALVLLERCARSPGLVALNLRAGLRRDRLPEDAWGAHFVESIERVSSMANARHLADRIALAQQDAPAD